MANILRHATAIWTGSGKEGSGNLSTESETLNSVPYSFSRRFGEEKGTNPEELIAAAHAGCFTMALAFQLSGAEHVPSGWRRGPTFPSCRKAAAGRSTR